MTIVTFWKLSGKCGNKFRNLLTDWKPNIFQLVDTITGLSQTWLHTQSTTHVRHVNL